MSVSLGGCGERRAMTHVCIASHGLGTAERFLHLTIKEIYFSNYYYTTKTAENDNCMCSYVPMFLCLYALAGDEQSFLISDCNCKSLTLLSSLLRFIVCSHFPFVSITSVLSSHISTVCSSSYF